MPQQIQVGAPVQFVDPTGYARQLQQQFIATKYAPVTLNSASGTSPQTVLTVPAGSYVFITGIQITIDPICTTGSGGMVNITLTDIRPWRLGISDGVDYSGTDSERDAGR